jgi:hypothetical protein
MKAPVDVERSEVREFLHQRVDERSADVVEMPGDEIAG